VRRREGGRTGTAARGERRAAGGARRHRKRWSAGERDVGAELEMGLGVCVQRQEERLEKLNRPGGNTHDNKQKTRHAEAQGGGEVEEEGRGGVVDE